jgi:hypothetical protein
MAALIRALFFIDILHESASFQIRPSEVENIWYYNYKGKVCCASHLLKESA